MFQSSSLGHGSGNNANRQRSRSSMNRNNNHNQNPNKRKASSLFIAEPDIPGNNKRTRFENTERKRHEFDVADVGPVGPQQRRRSSWPTPSSSQPAAPPPPASATQDEAFKTQAMAKITKLYKNQVVMSKKLKALEKQVEALTAGGCNNIYVISEPSSSSSQRRTTRSVTYPESNGSFTRQQTETTEEVRDDGGRVSQLHSLLLPTLSAIHTASQSVSANSQPVNINFVTVQQSQTKKVNINQTMKVTKNRRSSDARSNHNTHRNGNGSGNGSNANNFN